MKFDALLAKMHERIEARDDQPTSSRSWKPRPGLEGAMLEAASERGIPVNRLLSDAVEALLCVFAVENNGDELHVRRKAEPQAFIVDAAIGNGQTHERVLSAVMRDLKLTRAQGLDYIASTFEAYRNLQSHGFQLVAVRDDGQRFSVLERSEVVQSQDQTPALPQRA